MCTRIKNYVDVREHTPIIAVKIQYKHPRKNDLINENITEIHYFYLTGNRKTGPATRLT